MKAETAILYANADIGKKEKSIINMLLVVESERDDDSTDDKFFKS